MPVLCPYCQHVLNLKNPKPGRYTTTCPKCSRKFLLAIPEDPSKPPVVSGMKSERAIFETAASGSPGPSPAPRPAQPTPSTVESSPETAPTGEWASNASKPLKQTEGPAVTEPSKSTPAPSKPLPKTRPLADTTSPGGPMPDPASDGFVTVDYEPSGAGGSAADGAAVALKIGGYQVLKELGRGGMGAVYLAKQLSLNRNVALKVMKPEWCRNATFVARFTREAYAAAQLTHHNVVQIYDFGEDRGVTYFSMEFVEGQTLSGLVRKKKRLEVEEAVGYVLQAARGLKHAHDQSMIHRDIKPENLLLSTQGIVKVADLGLVKTPETAELDEAASDEASKGAKRSPVSAEPLSHITQANVAMGTPAFMSPEQAKDAASVDARADIYSLGCTLYDLVTGRPPFEGKTAIEILTKHQTEPVTPPDLVVKKVPKALSEIIVKMVAKRPEDRYPDLASVIAALEEFLGVRSSGPFQIREEFANQLTENANLYRSCPSANLRRWILPGIVGACLLIAVLALLTGKPIFAGGVLGFALMTTLADFVIGGIRGGTYLFSKVRQLVFTSSISDLLMAFAGFCVILVGLYVFNLFWVWVFLGAAAVCLALGLNVALDRKAELERAEVLESTEGILRTLRLHGLDEDALRTFVCRYSGDHWEEFYEALFGYVAKIDARAQWGIGTGGRPKPRFAAWRDPIVRWIDAKMKARTDAKDRKLLEKIEEKSLEAQGENLVVARRKAKRAAEAMVAVAAEMKQSQSVSRRDASMNVNHGIAKAMREAATKPETVLRSRESGLMEDRSPGFLSKILNTVIGPKPRFLVGLALLLGCLFWMKQNGIVSAKQLQTAVAVAESAAKSGDIEAIKAQGQAELERVSKVKVEETRILSASPIPKPLLVLVSSFGAGAAGLTLLFASFFRGVRIAFFAIPAAAIMILGPKAGLPVIQGIDPSLAPTAAGLAIMGVGLIFGRSRK